MSFLDRLRKARPEPARPRAPTSDGPTMLSTAQRRAMERALAQEGFLHRDAPRPAGHELRTSQVPVEELPIWSAPAYKPCATSVAAARPAEVAEDIEPLPLWTPPVFKRRVEAGPCPKCGDDLAVERIDLTANAGWLRCRACGFRWGGAIERPGLPAPPITSSAPIPSGGERGRAATG